jgi:hypothetical protein
MTSLQGHDADASSEPDGLCDQKQPCPDSDGPDGSRGALICGCETLKGDGRRDDSHHAKVHDAADPDPRD